MAYFIDLFSPETYEAFGRSSRDISGFRLRHKKVADRVHVGDRFVCYLTGPSRWFGVLEIIEGPFIDYTPIFVAEDDPFVVRLDCMDQQSISSCLVLCQILRSCWSIFLRLNSANDGLFPTGS